MTVQQARYMAAYNQWMNQKIYNACESLTDSDRKDDRGAFFKSIHGSLNHLLLADKIWMGRFLGEAFLATSLDQELHSDFAELQQDREKTDESILRWAATLEEETLAGTLHYQSMVNPAPQQFPLWLAVTHFFNHQTHHRGQITTLLSQSGLDVGVTDLLWMPATQS